jgi:hypothetical protein
VYRGEQILSLQNGGNIGRRLPKLLPAKNKKVYVFFNTPSLQMPGYKKSFFFTKSFEFSFLQLTQ